MIIMTLFKSDFVLNDGAIFFASLFSLYFMVSNLGFRPRRQQKILLIQSGQFHDYLHSFLVWNIIFFAGFVEKRVFLHK